MKTIPTAEEFAKSFQHQKKDRNEQLTELMIEFALFKALELIN